MSIYRFHFVDEGQDLTFVDVDSFDGDMGEIVACNEHFGFPHIYERMAVDFRKNKVGDKFTFADPRKGFKVHGSAWTIEKIEELAE